MSKLLLAFVLSLAACGGSKQPPSEPAQPTPPATEPTAMTSDECTQQGGQVRGDIGDGKIACAEGERELGRVKLGIEGGVCCAPASMTP
jgi:hypothetical protein